MFLVGFRIGLNVRGLERDRRRLLGRDRRAADRDRRRALRQLPDRGQPARLRARRLVAARSGERIQTNGRCEVGRRAGRHLRPRLLRGLPAGVLRRSAGAGSGTRCPRPTRPRSLWDLLCLVGMLARRACASAGRGSAATLGVRLGGVAVLPVLVELEHERHDPAGAARCSASTS